MHTYTTYEINSHNNINNILLQKRIIELPTKKTRVCKENESVGIEIHDYTNYNLGRIDPNHISNTPPNHFMETLKKRIDVYYNNTPDRIVSSLTVGEMVL